MIHYLAQTGSSSTGGSFFHDILVFAHYFFEWALPILGAAVLLFLFHSSKAIQWWHLAVPLALGWLLTGQYMALSNATEKIAHGGAAHIGTARSDVSVGTLFILIGLIVLVFFMARRGPVIQEEQQ
jgi:hypothetical protein